MEATSKTEDLAITLHEQIGSFRKGIKDVKRGVSKGDLVNLLIALMETPVERTVTLNKELESVYRLGGELKQTLTHLTIESMIEDSNAKDLQNYDK